LVAESPSTAFTTPSLGTAFGSAQTAATPDTASFDHCDEIDVVVGATVDVVVVVDVVVGATVDVVVVVDVLVVVVVVLGCVETPHSSISANCTLVESLLSQLQ
jgi:hypothetical protein